jgi:hypothetical protein
MRNRLTEETPFAFGQGTLRHGDPVASTQLPVARQNFADRALAGDWLLTTGNCFEE